MATHSTILVWEIPWTEEPGGLQSTGSQESNMTQWLNHHHHHLPIYLFNGPFLSHCKEKKKRAYRCSYPEMVPAVEEWCHREAPNVLISLNNE